MARTVLIAIKIKIIFSTWVWDLLPKIICSFSVFGNPR